MPNQQPASDLIPTEHLARVAGAIALAAVAVIHVLDLPSTLTATPLIGYGYLLLIAAALLGAAMLITVPGLRVWAMVNVIAVGAIGAYVLSRTTGLPTDPLDIGNWNCALGIAAVSTETLIVLLTAWQLQPQSATPGHRRAKQRYCRPEDQRAIALRWPTRALTTPGPPALPVIPHPSAGGRRTPLETAG